MQGNFNECHSFLTQVYVKHLMISPVLLDSEHKSYIFIFLLVLYRDEMRKRAYSSDPQSCARRSHVLLLGLTILDWSSGKGQTKQLFSPYGQGFCQGLLCRVT